MMGDLSELRDALFQPLDFVRAYDPAFLPLLALFLLLVALSATFPLVVLRGWLRVIMATVTLSAGVLVAGATGAWAYGKIQEPRAVLRTCIPVSPQKPEKVAKKQGKHVQKPKAEQSCRIPDLP